MATEAFITPRLLTWARERDRLTARQGAERLKLKPERLVAWENGTERPTLRQVEIAAQRLNVPFGYLFLSTPPEEHFPIPDLRTVGDRPGALPSPELRDIVNSALEKQNWYREYRKVEGASVLPFINRYDATNATSEELASDIRTTLGVNATLRAEAKTPDAFLQIFINRVEDAGVLVLRSGIVGMNTHRPLKVDEFRGFAVIDSFAPLIFLNAADARTAQVFTLAHELVHLWLGANGVSNPTYEGLASDQANLIERLCSRTAAEVLMPKRDFLAYWGSGKPFEKNIEANGNHFRVSALACARRALELDLISSEQFAEYYSRVAGRMNRDANTEKGGGNFYRTLLARNSRALTISLTTSLREGHTTYRDAARFLGIRVPLLEKVTQFVESL